MPTSLTFTEHLDALERHGTRLGDVAASTGLGVAVPTCPDWTIGALVAHQAMVHRWATANVRQTDPDAVAKQTEIRTKFDDDLHGLVDYYREGLAGLLDALRSAAADLEVRTFLNDAPPPRHFWARRQAHETTIHMVDAVAASLGRPPTAAEADIGHALAVDGIDELLRGFLTRGRSKLYDGTELTIRFDPSDDSRDWVVHVAESATVAPDDTATVDDDLDATITGTAAQLYLALWNRGSEVSESGAADVLALWRETQRIRWS